jgi:hypothetical protein
MGGVALEGGFPRQWGDSWRSGVARRAGQAEPARRNLHQGPQRLRSQGWDEVPSRSDAEGALDFGGAAPYAAPLHPAITPGHPVWPSHLAIAATTGPGGCTSSCHWPSSGGRGRSCREGRASWSSARALSAACTWGTGKLMEGGKGTEQSAEHALSTSCCAGERRWGRRAHARIWSCSRWG